jgi:Transcriptional regulator
MDRLKSMAGFVRAVELGSFVAAAEVLGLSAPMVGKHVRFLEDRLGVRLINRTTRKQSLTEIGLQYYERCRLILAEVAAADALASTQLAEPRGRLRVTTPVHFGRHCVIPILLTLMKKFPDLQLDLSLTDRLVDLVEEGFDLAVRTGNPENQTGVVGHRIARQRMIVCGAPNYLEANGRPNTIADLKNHSLYC